MAEVELVASKGGAGGTRLLMRRAEKIGAKRSGRLLTRARTGDSGSRGSVERLGSLPLLE